MKIAVVADIHANYTALLSIVDHIEKWKADHVIVAGDIVNRGPRPLECIEYIQQKRRLNKWLLVRGNHEDYVIEQSKPDIPTKGAFAEVHRPSRWTSEMLEEKVDILRDLPFRTSLFDQSGGEVRCVHASMAGIRDGIYPETPEWQLQEKISSSIVTPTTENLAVFVAGHTHRPFVRDWNGSKVVNAGSAGLPFDGDTRVSYAQLTYSHSRWLAKIIRVKYDLKQAEEDFYNFGYIDGGGPLVKLVQIELQHARSMLYSWVTLYQEDVLQGKISMDESVSRMINE